MKTKATERFTKKERSWILYDWANSVYATNIMAAIFPTVFVAFAGDKGDLWWGYGTSIATFLIAVLAPILGAVADFKGMKKKLFTVFMLLGVIFTALIAVTNDWRVMLLGYIISRIGFSGSNLFYDSFLTDVTTNERMDKVSSWGYAMGYIGGSTIPFLISIVMLLVLGYASPFAQKFSVIITSVWWLIFSIPFIKNVHQEHYIERTPENDLRHTFRNMVHTAVDIFHNKGLFTFMLAYFFYIDGVGTVISVSTAYGSVLGLGSVGMILALLVTQIVAVPCSIWFSRLAARISARKAIIAAICLYTVICLVGFYMGFSLEPHQMAYEQAAEEKFVTACMENAPESADYETMVQGYKAAFLLKDRDAQFEALADEYASTENAASVHALALQFAAENDDVITAFNGAISFSSTLFWCMAFLVGTVQGGIQAVSRSYFSKLVPKDRSNEYFGFFDIFGKFASVIGPVLYAFISSQTGRSSFGVLGLVLLFMVGLGILIKGKKHLEALEAVND